MAHPASISNQGRVATAHLPSFLQPADVACMAVCRAPDDSRRVTGKILGVDSGMSIV